MALKAELGFGMMRLPVKNGNATDFDYEHLNRMVDAYLAGGYNYFDTSYVYHNGKSEEAVRKAVVERHPRATIRIATKFPTFLLKAGDEDKIEAYFQEQLDRLGVDYIDYYLLHNFQTRYYDGFDGNGGVIQSEHLIEHALAVPLGTGEPGYAVSRVDLSGCPAAGLGRRSVRGARLAGRTMTREETAPAPVPVPEEEPAPPEPAAAGPETETITSIYKK